MKKLVIILSLLSIIISAIAIGIVVYSVQKNSKIAYADNDRLYNQFIYTQEVQKELGISFKKQKTELDSIYRIGQIAQEELNTTSSEKEKKALLQQVKYRRQEYDQKLAAFQKNNEGVIQDQELKVRTRLNKYIKEYGEKHHFKVILGVKGDGSVLFGQPDDDITEQLIDYVNQQYEDK